MKYYIILLIMAISSCSTFSQSTFEEKQKKIVLEVIDAIIKNDSTKFYSIVDTPKSTKHQIIYDYKFLNKKFQSIKSQITIDSIKSFIKPNSIWKWNYRTQVYISKSHWDYVDLTFMFNSEVSNKVFYFSKEVQSLNEPIKAPGMK